MNKADLQEVLDDIRPIEKKFISYSGIDINPWSISIRRTCITFGRNILPTTSYISIGWSPKFKVLALTICDKQQRGFKIGTPNKYSRNMGMPKNLENMHIPCGMYECIDKELNLFKIVESYYEEKS